MLIRSEKLRGLFFEHTQAGPQFVPSRYKVAHGGRGSGKSWGFARVLVAMAACRKMRVLCARELQNSISESVHRLLSDQIQALGLAPYYGIQNARISSSIGSEFIFEGLRNNVTKIKSMEGIDVVWVEEAEKVSAPSWDVLIPTIRKPGSEIWVTFNPNKEDDPTFRRLVLSPPPGARVVQINWEDNPDFPEELRKEKDYLYSVDPGAAAHVWGGECLSFSDAQVLNGKTVVEDFTPQPGWDGPYQGADWGFAQDPTTLVRCWVNGDDLLIEYEAYGIGVDIDKTPGLFDQVPMAREYITRADCARPETISYMQRHGYGRMLGVEKWPGSVEDGVTFLRGFRRIVIHTRCRHAEQEARLWSYKVDKLTGDVLPELVDSNNHIWDAVRYALAPLIKKRDGMLGWLKQSVAVAQDRQREAQQHG